MNKHIKQLARQHQINILKPKDVRRQFGEAEANFLISFGSCALRRLRSVFLRPEGKPRIDYMVAMHEIGHIMNPVRGWRNPKFDYRKRLRDEQQAWEWAFANARPRIKASDVKVAFESFLCHVLHPRLDGALELVREAYRIRKALDILSEFPDDIYKLQETVRLEVKMSEVQERWNSLSKES